MEPADTWIDAEVSWDKDSLRFVPLAEYFKSIRVY